MSEMYKSLKKGMESAVAWKQGKKTGVRVHRVKVEVPDVAEIRGTLHMTQSEFSKAFAIPLATLRKWEQGQRIPHGPARALLKIIAYRPKLVLQALRAAE
jgi:putative transcriptional regulator